MSVAEISLSSFTIGEDKIDIRVARSISEVEALRELWMRRPGHRDSDIDFYLMIVQSYPEVLCPHVIALYRNDHPEAILIGRMEEKKISFPVGYLRTFGPKCHCLTFVYDAVRGNASVENVQILVREVMNCLMRDEADVALLEFVPLGSDLHRAALGLPGRLGRDTLPASQKHDVLEVPDKIDAIYQRMSGTRREGIRRGIRKFRAHADGKDQVICYENECQLDLLFGSAEEIAKKTYQRGLGAGFADTPDARKRLGLAARKGWLRGYVLYLEDRPCAFWIGMLYESTFVSEYLGYDPEFRQYSPGMFLIMNVIEAFCARKNGDIVKELDFGLGHAEYKAALCSKVWLEASIYIFSLRPKGLMLKVMRTSTRIVDEGLRRVLAKVNLATKLKRAWRDRLAQRARNTSNNNNKNRTVNIAANPGSSPDDPSKS